MPVADLKIESIRILHIKAFESLVIIFGNRA